jgi:hypothetical protein
MLTLAGLACSMLNPTPTRTAMTDVEPPAPTAPAKPSPTARPTDPPIASSTEVPTSEPTPAAGNDQPWLAWINSHSRLLVAAVSNDLAAFAPVFVSQPEALVDGFAWSPDGTQLAYPQVAEDSANVMLATLERDNTGAPTLTDTPTTVENGLGSSLTFTPDGAAIGGPCFGARISGWVSSHLTAAAHARSTTRPASSATW